MANFVLAYRGGSVPDSEADQQAAMEAWMGWFGGLGDAAQQAAAEQQGEEDVRVHGVDSIGLRTGRISRVSVWSVA